MLPSSTFNLFTLSGTVSYALDIWGGQRRQVEALGAAVDAQRYALAGAYVMLASNVVDAVIAQAAYRDGDRGDEGDASRFCRSRCASRRRRPPGAPCPTRTSSRLQSQLASTEATLPPLEEKIDQAADLLAALTGMTPAKLAAAAPGAVGSASSRRTLPSEPPVAARSAAPRRSHRRGRSCTRPTPPSAWRRRRCSPTSP